MTLPFYPFYWGDYSAKTFDLTMMQHGAYMLFMRHVYTTGKNIDDNLRYQVAKANTVDERNAADFVLANYWRKKDGFWRQPRVLEIMDDAEKLHQVYVNRGKKPKKFNLSPTEATITKTNKIKNKSLEGEVREHLCLEGTPEWEQRKRLKGGILNARDIQLPSGQWVRGSYFKTPLPDNVVPITRMA